MMATSYRNRRRNINPGLNSCPECYDKECRCFITGCSVTYKKVIRELCEALDWPHPSTGLPSTDWQEIVRRLRR